MTANRSSRARWRRGLTLVELLASAVLLSAAGAAIATIVRDAGAAARRADRTRRALALYDEWRVACASSGDEAKSFATNGVWEHADGDGSVWRVRVGADAQESASSVEGPTTDTSERVAWAFVIVELARDPESSSDDPVPILAIHRVAPMPVVAGAPIR